MRLVWFVHIFSIIVAVCCRPNQYGVHPDDLERVAESRRERAMQERQDANALSREEADCREFYEKMRSQAMREDDLNEAYKCLRKAEDAIDKAEDIPDRVKQRRQKADELSREAEQLLRYAKEIRDGEKDKDEEEEDDA